MGNICRNYFEFGQLVLMMLLKKIYFSSGGFFFSRVEPFVQFWQRESVGKLV